MNGVETSPAAERDPAVPRCAAARWWLALLGEDRLVNVINSGAELDEGGPPADVIVMDVPAQERRAAYEQVRRYYRGPLVILLGRGDNGNDLPPDPSRTLLTPVFTP